MSAAATAALQAALRMEHEVVYGYGAAGAHLDGRPRQDCLRRLDAHLVLRDRLAALVRAADAAPAAPRAAYALPEPLTGRAVALALLSRLEDATCGVMWDLTAASPAASDPRRLAVPALAEAADWSARWRSLAGDTGVTVLPGRP